MKSWPPRDVSSSRLDLAQLRSLVEIPDKDKGITPEAFSWRPLWISEITSLMEPRCESGKALELSGVAEVVSEWVDH